MIGRPELDALVALFDLPPGGGLFASLSAECARLLRVSDVTISFFGASGQVTLGASSADAAGLGEWEFTFGEGPCVAAAAEASSTTGTTAADRTRWPKLSAKARLFGYLAIAGTPLKAGGRTFATLNLETRHGPITSATLADAEQISSEIAPFVLARLVQHAPPLEDLGDHHVVHQASGMVLTQMGITAMAAVEVLRAHAWAHDRLLVDVAEDVVSGTLTFD